MDYSIDLYSGSWILLGILLLFVAIIIVFFEEKNKVFLQKLRKKVIELIPDENNDEGIHINEICEKVCRSLPGCNKIRIENGIRKILNDLFKKLKIEGICCGKISVSEMRYRFCKTANRENCK